ncbi:MAG TPA: phosphoribosylanthranilate isomerase [Casimicrobiaceae bacterium]|nr:phosphoribosylanthranilate isomerase [Casimicrobiaceae bacterium]
MTTRQTTRVKICGITRVADGIVAADAGAYAIGLNFWSGTPRRVSIETAQRIVAALPASLFKVALFVDPTRDEVEEVLRALRFDTLQFHGSESPEFCASFERPYFKAIAMKEGVDLVEYAGRYKSAAGLIFDSWRAGDTPGGTGHAFDWKRLDLATRIRLKSPIILSGGLDPDNVREAIMQVRPWAVDVSSGVEERGPDGKPRRGIKDPARIAAFMDGVRSADGT